MGGRESVDPQIRREETWVKEGGGSGGGGEERENVDGGGDGDGMMG